MTNTLANRELVGHSLGNRGRSVSKIAVLVGFVSLMLFLEGCQTQVVGPGGVVLPSKYRIPDANLAKPIAQLQSNWCWAASGEMVLSWRRHRVGQCDQANLYPHKGIPTCCPEDPHCNAGHFPDKSFAPGKTDYKRNRSTPLPPEVIQEEIASNRPFIFSWKDCDKNCGPTPTGHMMVLVGYEVIGDRVVFDVLDPWPPHEGGNIPRVNYDQFVAFKPGQSHWDDFYAFKDGIGVEYH
jgi:hypothetical protein